ncbi:hypothetical protein [Flavitalea sp.]|nr:hypothetical protein [Flavitalea sp.]
MPKNSALASHSYAYRFPSLVKDTLEFNARWNVHIIQGQKKYEEAIINLQEASKAMDLRYGSPNPPGYNDLHRLERNQDEVNAMLRRLRGSKEQLTYSLQISARLLVEMWQEMYTDLNDGELSVTKYCEYLHEFAGVIETGANHKIFETISFQEIKTEIAKHLPAKV